MGKNDILKSIKDSVRKACGKFMGVENTPETPEQIAQDLQRLYNTHVTKGQPPEVIVTPTDDPKIFNVSVEVPIHRYKLEVKLPDKEEI